MRLARSALTAATVVALVSSTGLTGAGAAPATAPDSPGSAEPGATTVTLITGDRVTVTTGADGEPAYSVSPVPGADRTSVTFEVTTVGEDTYILPSDVADLTGAAAVLDRELFNVTRLLADGLDDAHTTALPLIVQRADGGAVSGVDGVRQGRALDVLGARAVKLDKDATADFGEHLAAADTTAVPAKDVRAAKERGSVAPRRQLDADADDLAGVSRIWLNGKVEAAAWDTNLTQVGAPAAWEAGVTGAGVKVAVLDTGIDAGHPDLTGKVDAQANFSSSASMTDVVGHGTHVAGTIAGTGAAAPGIRQGVAPDARLLIGKVLGDDGRGDLAASVEGMEWAAEQGADIVNMSLGAAPTDGTDPVSTALNQLSTEHGTLFVVAAGNAGPGSSTVGSPASADDALAVAAVDATGTVAAFSSRGPRVGDSAMKPEIAAPGVAITAPKSSAMKASTPDPKYVTMSGTSMATPHVAGVAALLAQRHPDWSGQRIKAVLMSTATAASGGMDAVGAGAADATAALGAQIVAEAGNVGFQLAGNTGPVSRTVTLTNTGSEAATVSLATSVDGTDLPATALSVSPAAADIPAGGSVTATVTVDGSLVGTQGAAAALTGALTVTPATGTALRLPVTATRTRWLNVTGHTTTGAPAPGTTVYVLNLDTGAYTTSRLGADGTARIPVLPGRLAVSGTVQEWDDAGRPTTSLVTTEVTETGTTAELDADATVPIGAQVEGRATREEMALVRLTRVNESTRTIISNGVLAGGAYGLIERGSLRITPTEGRAADDTVWLDEHWVLANKDSDNRTGDATLVYDLLFHRDTVPADPVHKLNGTDVSKLARLDVDFHSMNEDSHRNQVATTAIGEQISGLNTVTPSYVAVPLHQTRYTTAEDVLWATQGFHSDTVPGGSLTMNVAQGYTAYGSGERYEQDWWGGPLGATASATLSTGRLAVSGTSMVDSDGHRGGFGEFTSPQRGSGGTRVYRDGVQLPYSSAITVDGRTAASYRLERWYDGQDVFPLGGRTSTVWETEPVAVGADGADTALPLAELRWDSRDLDLANRARAGRDTRVDVYATSQALAPADRHVTEVEAAYTTDGGATWKTAEVYRTGYPKNHRFTIAGGELTAGTWVGLRFRAVDAAGNSVAQTLLRAFQVH
ncbi:S8 family serine peptidase [Streptomyces sp. NPDC051940]|uniref:S8 family serine peptidase n=1 Tax=Streptomyces sp. NPDC051940 TaxID=3155675 RepID=UPI00342D5386